MTLRFSTHKQTLVRTPARKLRQLFDDVTDEEADPDWKGWVNLIFTNDAAIRKLNREYRNNHQATDVLSFNIDSPDEEQSTFGEIYISVSTATRQAKEYGGTLSGELLRLFCHGLLHVFGYDHSARADKLLMQRREAHFLERVGERFTA